MNHNLRKLVFNSIKRNPRLPDALFLGAIFSFNAVLFTCLDLWSELSPSYFTMLALMILVKGRRSDIEKMMKDLLREGDVVSFTMRGGNIHIGMVSAPVPPAEFGKLGIKPGREYISVVDDKGESRVMPLANLLALE